MKHNDKDVAAAASKLRTRWMEALAGGGSSGGGGESNNTPKTSLASAATPATPSSSGGGSGGGGGASNHKKKPPPSLERTPKVEAGGSGGGVRGEGGDGRREPKRENINGKGSPRGTSANEGGRYGTGRREEEKKAAAASAAAAEGVTVKSEAKKEAPGTAGTTASASKVPPAVVKDEVSHAEMVMGEEGVYWFRTFFQPLAV